MDSEAGRVGLLGCPKCRSVHIKAYDPDGVRILGEPRIVCGWCFLEQPGHTIEAATIAWNTRPTPDNGLREALERLSKSVEHAIDMADESGGMGWYAALDELRAGNVAAVSALQPNTGERDA